MQSKFMTTLPKLSAKKQAPKQDRCQTIWVTEEMSQQIKHLKKLRGNRVVSEWLRDCWSVALTEAVAEKKTGVETLEKPEEKRQAPASDLDYDYEY